MEHVSIAPGAVHTPFQWTYANAAALAAATGFTSADVNKLAIQLDTSTAYLCSAVTSGTPTWVPFGSGGSSVTKSAVISSGVLSTDLAGASATALATEATNRANADTLLAPKASPAMTGTPTVPTASPGTNTTQAASCAFVTAAIAAFLAALQAGGVVFAVRESSGVYPARSTTLAGSASTVLEIGKDANTIGGAGAQNDTDIWLPISVSL